MTRFRFARVASWARRTITALALVLAPFAWLSGHGILFAQVGDTAQVGDAAQVGGTRGEVVVLEVAGAIGPATTRYVRKGLDAATARRAALVVLRMDTPGGLDAAMRDIIRDILASPVPVATYVAPSGARAASAGTYLLYASHVAAMAPGTNLGAATPVQIGGGGNGESPTAKKAINDAVAYIRGLAELRGRNADWAEKAVREAESLDSRAAFDQGIVDILADDLDALLRRADGRVVDVRDVPTTLRTAGAAVVAHEPDWRTRILAVITNPNIAYILMLVGIYGIIFEFASPGTVFSGVIGAICLIVGLFALNLLPVNYAGAGLIMLGIALMLAESFTPSFGILGIGGAVAFALGSMLMFEGEIPGFTLSLPVVLVATAASVVLALVVFTAAIRSHRRPVVTGEGAFVGSSGRVLSWSGRTGEVEIFGERWHAHSRNALEAGQEVRVARREGLELEVEPAVDDQRR